MRNASESEFNSLRPVPGDERTQFFISRERAIKGDGSIVDSEFGRWLHHREVDLIQDDACYRVTVDESQFAQEKFLHSGNPAFLVAPRGEDVQIPHIAGCNARKEHHAFFDGVSFDVLRSLPVPIVVMQNSVEV